MSKQTGQLKGLSPEEVLNSRARHGSNHLYVKPKRYLLLILLDVAKEPIFLLLLLACGLYFAIGDVMEAWLMVGSVAFVIIIEIIQEYRSEKALTALRSFSQPLARVIRDAEKKEIPAEELVVGDLLVFEEGERLAADGELVQQGDLTVDEAVLTGESLPVDKNARDGENKLYQGTTVASGQGIARVSAVGAHTELGKLGKSIESIETSPTPLQMQIDRFVRQMLIAGLIAFLIVFSINYVYAGSFLSALLFSLAFALALVPEEIPVAFTTFMALGAYRMTRQQVLVKQPKTVESLGAATVICLDKTGTITENRMSVAETSDFSGAGHVLEYAMWASEPEPFDAMEKAIHEAYGRSASPDRREAFDLVHEYPLSGVPPMMTHVHAPDGGGDSGRIVAAKGAVERMVRVCRLDAAQRKEVMRRTREMAGKGFRVLGVASATWDKALYPDDQDAFPWVFEGLVALHDPPKPNIRRVIERFYEAHIDVKMITGDYPETAMHIARESGIRVNGPALVGEEVMNMPDAQLREAAEKTVVFARMFPDAKLRVVEALKANGAVVAMTGDGVNDGPALKSAQVSVAMGQRGTEIAKGAASMVLLDDDLSHMVNAISTGRRIYNNLRKAIRYVISIHVPIILVVLLPLLFGWPYLHMLMPVHVIFLELIMDPTCAVAFENEPAEPNVLKKPPHYHKSGLFSRPELSLSIFQGLVITAGIFLMYHHAIAQGYDEQRTRSFVFLTLLTSNILLTLVNRSFDFTVRTTLFYPNKLLWWIIVVSFVIAALILSFPPARELFRMGVLTPFEAGLCVLTALVSVGWFEVWKWWRNRFQRASD